MVPQATLVGAPAVIMLNAVRVEAFDLTIILGYYKLHQDFPLWCQKQSLQLLGVLKLLKSLWWERPMLDPYVTICAAYPA